MFKKLRLWLIKKLKATPNEYFKNNPIEVKTTTIPVQDYNFIVNIPQTDSTLYDELYVENKVKNNLYKDLIDKNIIKLIKRIDSEKGIITFYCRFGIAQKEEEYE